MVGLLSSSRAVPTLAPVPRECMHGLSACGLITGYVIRGIINRVVPGRKAFMGMY